VDPVVVIGLGRFGEALALELARRGTEVLAVDSRPDVVQRLSGQISAVVTADTADLDALREIGVQDFARAVVAIGTDQQASILTTANLAELEVEHIWAKALNRQHAKILERVGAHRVVLPEHDMGERVAHLVSGRLLDYVEVDTDWALVKTKPPKFLVGTPLGQSRLRAKHGVTVVSVKKQGESGFTHADAQTLLSYGDQVLVAGTIDAVERFAETL
jgi:trk system potassium uptake protein TrkA